MRVLRRRLRSMGEPLTAFDIGCATGELLELLADSGFSTAGIDCSPEMVRHARTRLAPAKSEVKCGDCRDARHWPEGPFALVTAFGSVFNLLQAEDWGVVFQEIRKILRPDGTFIFSIDNILGSDTIPLLFSRLGRQTRSNFGFQALPRLITTVRSNGAWHNDWPLVKGPEKYDLALSYLPLRKVRALLTQSELEVTHVSGANLLASLVPSVLRSSTDASVPDSLLGRAMSKVDYLLSDSRLAAFAANSVIVCRPLV